LWSHGSSPLAYALILLRLGMATLAFYTRPITAAHYKRQGRDGGEYEIWLDSHRLAHRQFLLVTAATTPTGDQVRYFDSPQQPSAGTRSGDKDNPGRHGGAAEAAVMMGGKWMEVGKPTAFFQ